MEDELLIGSRVTEIGSQKLVKAASSSEKVDIKYIVIGDANGEAYIPDASMTELKNECWQGTISSYEISPNDPKQLVIKAVVPSEVGHFVMREIGIKDADGDLIALSNTGELELIPYKFGQILNLNITFIVQFKSSEIGAVNIVVEPTDQEVLKEEILKEVNQTIESKLENVEVTLYVLEENEVKEIVGTVWDDPYEDEDPNCDCDEIEEATDADIDGLF